jgi:hypothetical protein
VAIRGTFKRNIPVNSNRPTRLNWGQSADSRHSSSATGNDHGFPAPTNAPIKLVPANLIDGYDPEGINAKYTQPSEREPSGHGGTGKPPRSANPYEQQRADGARHQENFGATLKNTAAMVMRSITQTFGSPLVESLPPAPDDTASLTGGARRALRGFNGYALNNPGDPLVNGSGNYVRRGRELFRLTDRSMKPVSLSHTKRPIYINLAQSALVTQGPSGRQYSPNTSPYTSVGQFRAGTEKPMLRREPPMWDQSAVSDGSESLASDSSQYLSWGL